MCVCFDGRFARPEQANGPTGRGRRMERRDRFGLGPKQTRAQSGGAAWEERAREAGKPGAWVQRRGEAAWPNARRTEGPFPLRHAKPSWGGRKAEANVDVQATTLATTRIQVLDLASW